MKKAFFVGSFDPITNGHMDIVKRAYNTFGNISLIILENKSKKYYFSQEIRKQMIQEALKEYNIDANIYIDNTLLVDCVKKYNIDVVVKGIRDEKDFSYELVQNRVNMDITEKPFEIMYFLSSNQNSYISSSIVRELLSYNSDISRYVPKSIIKYIN